MSDIIQCPIGLDDDEPHTYVQGSGRLAFYNTSGLAGQYREVCQECAHPMNDPVVVGGLELAPDLTIYSVWVGGGEINDQLLTPRQAIDLAYEWVTQGYGDVGIDVSADSSQASYSWSEMAELTHVTQVKMFGWCGCEDNDGHVNPYLDCTWGKSALELPSGFPEIIMRWATSVINSMDYQEFGGDWWHTWRSPAGLHTYDINIHAPYDEDDMARVVVYELTTDENGDVVTDTSSFYFVGNVDISHMR